MPGPVEAARVGILGLLDHGEGERDRGDPDRHVDEEDRLPADPLGEHAADERADRPPPRRWWRPRARTRCRGRGPVGRGEQGERGGEHERAADALQRAREVERERRAGEPAQHRGDREDDEADHEHEPPADAVGERAARQQQRGERERVGVDHPLQVGEVGAEVALDRGQRDVHDRDVEQQHECRRADGDQGPPLAVHLRRQYDAGRG